MKNIKIRSDIIEILKSDKDYNEKINHIYLVLKSLLTNHVKFIQYDNNSIANITNINLCKDGIKNKLCDSKNRFLIPQTNLIDKSNNSKNYLLRISDELIRYKNFHDYLLEPTSQIHLPRENLKLNTDEIILLDSELNSKYFDNLKFPSKQQHININNNITDLQTNSNAEIKYNNTIKLIRNQQDNIDYNDPTCIKSKFLGGRKFDKFFPSKYYEIVYDDTFNCGFSMILDLIKLLKKKTKTVEEIKNDLIYEYNILISNNSENMKRVFLDNNRNQFVKSLKNGTDIATLINMPDFYISITDLWILCIKYNMPVILLSPNPRGLRENNKMLLPLQISEDSNYVFIISDSPRTDKPHKYSIVSKSEKISDSIINIYKLPNSNEESIPELFDKLKNKHYIKKQAGDKNMNIEKPGLLTLELYINYIN